MSQTTPLKNSIPDNRFSTIEGYPAGYTRNGVTGHSEAAYVYGGRMPVGRVVVASPVYNSLTPAQQRARGVISAMLPDDTGEYTTDNINGLPLTNAQNATLLGNTKDADGNFCVLGVSVKVSDCENCDCSECRDLVDPCPRGNPDVWLQYPVGRQHSVFTIATQGDYVSVRTSVALKKGDLLDLVTTYDPADADCVGTLGNVTLRGSGDQELPDSWVVSGAAGAGEFVEIFLGGLA